jgi:hypothetical protein
MESKMYKLWLQVRDNWAGGVAQAQSREFKSHSHQKKKKKKKKPNIMRLGSCAIGTVSLMQNGMFKCLLFSAHPLDPG